MPVKDELRLAVRVANDERQPRAIRQLHDGTHVDPVAAKMRDKRFSEAITPDATDHRRPHAETGEPRRDVGGRAAQLPAESARDGLGSPRASLEDVPEDLTEANDLPHHRHRGSRPVWAARARSTRSSTVAACPSVARFA